MTRRTALKLLGAMIVCLVGNPVASATDKKTYDSGHIKDDWRYSKTLDYAFSEEGIGNIIIETKDGEKLIIPFSDIVEALREEAK